MNALFFSYVYTPMALAYKTALLDTKCAWRLILDCDGLWTFRLYDFRYVSSVFH